MFLYSGMLSISIFKKFILNNIIKKKFIKLQYKYKYKYKEFNCFNFSIDIP